MVTYANDIHRICIWVVEHVFIHVFYRPYLKTESMGNGKRAGTGETD